MSKPPIDRWAGFLAHEKLHPARLDASRLPDLLRLAEALAASGPPAWPGMHKDTLASRLRVVCTAMDLGLDLLSWKLRGRPKPAIGRGLLDAWNAEYQRRFGSTTGTAGAAESARRGVSTKLAAQ